MLSALKRIRLERGLTQWDAAKAVDIDRTLISHWENRRVKPSQEQLAQLAEFYGVEVGELLQDK